MTISSKSIFKYASAFILVSVLALIYFEIRDTTELKRFRQSSDPFPASTQVTPSRKGLDTLRISGSNRVSQSSLKKSLAHIPAPVYIFDLRAEPHFYLEDLPEHWYGYQPTRVNDIPQTLKGVKMKHLLRRLLKTGKLIHTAKDTQTEREIVEELGYSYLYIKQKRHSITDKDLVDDFIAQVSKLPQNSWVHFHCTGGQGRTTIAMVMYDILKNKDVSLEDIIQRQYLLGGENLFDTTVWQNGTYTKEMLEGRKNFVVLFYEYVHDPKGLGIKSWVEWEKGKISNSAYL